MSSEKLEQAINAYKSGEKQKAGKLLVTLLQSEPNNEDAWLWLAGCVETHEQRQRCLKRVLKINPNNILAKQALQKNEDLQLLQKDITQPNQRTSVNFFAANCPNCNGELRIPNNRASIKCMYCGQDIHIDGQNSVSISSDINLQNILSLAMSTSQM